MAHGSAAPRVASPPAPSALALDDPRARGPDLAGAKAANLARAAVAGLPVLPGFVIPTSQDTESALDDDGLRALWRELSVDGTQPLVVRSSSVAEDAESSSLAGQFTSVLDVLEWDSFCDAVREVRSSAVRVGKRLGEVAPMAVLVQPQVTTACAGVLFGVDPMSGDPRRLLAEAVRGSPDELVSGRVTAQRYLLSRQGRCVSPRGDLLDRGRCRALARLAARARRVFGAPQDIEWGYDEAGRLWLLQSRPVTTVGDSPVHGAVLLGPGPVAETFPAPLRTLEADLWVAPLAEGIGEALHLTGSATRHHLQQSPIVKTVHGRIAADLRLLGVVRSRRTVLAGLAPAPAARHLAAAWRVGRLRAALPALAADLVGETDAALAHVPALRDLDDDELLGLLRRCRRALVAVHGHEALAGALLTRDDVGSTASGVALRTLSSARAGGLDDETVVAEHPVVLALVPPRIGGGLRLPEVTPRRSRPVQLASLPTREALRLRTRWLQELSGRAALELGRRLQETGGLDDPELVVHLTWDELARAVAGDGLPDDLLERAAMPPGPPLPAAFRLTPSGAVSAVTDTASRAGTGAAPGRAVGTAVDLVEAQGGVLPAAAVLVTRTLDPDLAGLLPHLTGLVSETGSVLSHLAILARELHVPTVVSVPDAVRRFPPGTRLLLDGESGEVRRVESRAEVAGP